MPVRPLGALLSSTLSPPLPPPASSHTSTSASFSEWEEEGVEGGGGEKWRGNECFKNCRLQCFLPPTSSPLGSSYLERMEHPRTAFFIWWMNHSFPSRLSEGRITQFGIQLLWYGRKTWLWVLGNLFIHGWKEDGHRKPGNLPLSFFQSSAWYPLNKVSELVAVYWDPAEVQGPRNCWVLQVLNFPFSMSSLL